MLVPWGLTRGPKGHSCLTYRLISNVMVQAYYLLVTIPTQDSGMLLCSCKVDFIPYLRQLSARVVDGPVLFSYFYPELEYRFTSADSPGHSSVRQYVVKLYVSCVAVLFPIQSPSIISIHEFGHDA